MPLKDVTTCEVDWTFVKQQGATEHAETDDKPHVSRHVGWNLKAGSRDYKAGMLLLERNIR